MDDVFGALAFAGIVAAHVFAVVAMHEAKPDGSGNPLGRSVGVMTATLRGWRLTLVAAALLFSVAGAPAQNAAVAHATEPAHHMR